MKRAALVSLMFWMSMSLGAKKIAVFSDIIQPQRMYIDGDEVIIVDGRRGVGVYALPGGEFLREISKQGQGPGEFQFNPFLKVFPDSIYFCDQNKIMEFSRSGEFLGEKRLVPRTRAFPAKENYAAFGSLFIGETRYTTVNLLDSDLKIRKELFRQSRDNIQRGVNPVGFYTGFDTYDGEIYIAEGSKGFTIEVFDSEGRILRTIQKDIEKIKISNAFKTDYIAQLMTQTRGGGEWKSAVERWGLSYPKFFPDFREFQVAEDKIFVQTYKKAGDSVEFIILDLQGNILTKIFLPLFTKDSLVDRFIYSFHKNHYYFLKYADSSEKFELHRIGIQNP